MLNQANLESLHSAISSPELEGGAELCRSQGGQQIDLFGREAHHANHLARQENKKEKTMSDTSGQYSSISLESANLQQSLESRLQRLSGTGGSMIYSLTLKKKDTPAGRSYCQLGASARTTKGTGCSSQPNAWPTPQHSDNVVKRTSRKWREQGGVNMALSNPELQPWPTPTTRDYKDTGDLSKSMVRKDGKTRLDSVGRVASMVSWATPTATDHSRGTKPPRPHDTGIPLTQQVSGLTQKSSTAETESTAQSQLNPRFSLWLMGYPIEWAYSGERVTPSSRKRRQK